MNSSKSLKLLRLKLSTVFLHNPKKVFALLSNSEVREKVNCNMGITFPEWSELKNIKLSYQKVSPIILSVIALDHTRKSLRKSNGAPISCHIFKETRMYGLCYGSGADVPQMKMKTLCFTENDLKKIVQFILSSDSTSGLAWGEKSYTAFEGKQYAIPNVQRKYDSQLWKNNFVTLHSLCTCSTLRKSSHEKLKSLIEARAELEPFKNF
jgi:hypothetical protein